MPRAFEIDPKTIETGGDDEHGYVITVSDRHGNRYQYYRLLEPMELRSMVDSLRGANGGGCITAGPGGMWECFWCEDPDTAVL